MTNKKRFITLAMTVSLMGSSLLPVFAQNFEDLKQNYWAYDSIQSLADQNIISGYSDSTFRPDSPVTRAEFATMIIKTLNKENMSVSGSSDFRDVSRSFWAYDNVQRAYDLGLIKGFPDNTFKPNANITRTEVMSILASAGRTNAVSRAEAEQILNRFYDEDRVPNWAVVPVAKAVKANLVVNYPQPNFLMPEKRASRAEVAAMLFNLRKELGYNQQTYQQSSYNQTGYVPQQSYQQPATVEQITQAAASGATTDVVLRGSIATVQENSIIPTVLESPLSSEVASAGDSVYLKVTKNVTTNQGTLLIPAGSKISGKIKSVIPAKYANRNAKIDIDFNTITLPTGQSYPLVASIATESGVLESGTLKSKIGKGVLMTAGGAGAGAALGTALGAITGNTGKGAIYGTAIGGGLGVVGSILTQGGAIQIPSGEPLFIKLDRPVSIDMNTGNFLYQ